MSVTSTTSPAVSSARLWGSILLAFLLSLVFLVTCAYGWVFIYSQVVHTGGDAAYYEAYAQVASPVVAVVLSFPVFYYVGRHMRRFGGQAVLAAMAVAGINIIMDALVVMSVDAGAHLTVMSLIAAAGKLAGAYEGSRAGS